ncbi:MAG: ATP-binding protein [Anaerolineae bacterium]
MVEEHALCVKSDLSNLAQIADFVALEAAQLGLNEDQVFNIQMAVDEACTNSMEHAYDGDVTGEVTVCCYKEDNDLVIRVSDLGKPFDPSSVPEPDITLPLEERSIGGLGLYLMRKLMDSVEFRAQAVQGNEVTMRKHLNHNSEKS